MGQAQAPFGMSGWDPWDYDGKIMHNARYADLWIDHGSHTPVTPVHSHDRELLAWVVGAATAATTYILVLSATNLVAYFVVGLLGLVACCVAYVSVGRQGSLGVLARIARGTCVLGAVAALIPLLYAVIATVGHW